MSDSFPYRGGLSGPMTLADPDEYARKTFRDFAGGDPELADAIAKSAERTVAERSAPLPQPADGRLPPPVDFPDILPKDRTGELSRFEPSTPRRDLKLTTPARADFGLPTRVLERGIKEVEALEKPETFIAAEQAVQEKRDEFNAARLALTAYNPSPVTFKTFSSKVFATLAIALGEFAKRAEGKGGPNVGLDMITKIVDDEVNRQKQTSDLLKERVNFADNAYARAFDALRDERQAFRLAKDALFEQVLKKVDIAGDQVKNSAGYNELVAEIRNAQEINAQEANQAQREAEIQAAERNVEAQQSQILKPEKRLLAEEKQKSLQGLSSDVATAVKFLDEYKGKAFDEGYGLLKDALSKAVSGAEEPESAFGSFQSQIAKQLIGDQSLISFYNIIGKVAFGLASKDQAASSISNRDVQNFQKFLADKSRPMSEVREYLNMFAVISEADARFQAALSRRYTQDEARAERDKFLRSQGVQYVSAPGGGGSYQTSFTAKANGVEDKYRKAQDQQQSAPLPAGGQ
jgi:hypothetical protein